MPRPNKLIHLLQGLAFLLALVACKNSDEALKPFVDQVELQVEKGKNVTITYTDSGYLVATIKADEVKRFTAEPIKTEMIGNVVAYFYNNQRKPSSKLTSDKAIRYDLAKEVEAIGNVILVNETNDTLTTEKLRWDEKNNRIFTEEFVRIKTKDEMIYGDGLESNQQFTKYRILNPKGVTSLRD